jgi:cell division protein FtsB
MGDDMVLIIEQAKEIERLKAEVARLEKHCKQLLEEVAAMRRAFNFGVSW